MTGLRGIRTATTADSAVAKFPEIADVYRIFPGGNIDILTGQQANISFGTAYNGAF